MKRPLCPALLLAVLLTTPLAAQPASDPPADLRFMLDRAAQIPQVDSLLRQFQQQARSMRPQARETGALRLRSLLAGHLNLGRMTMTDAGYDYGNLRQRQVAAARAQMVGTLLRADLNGDWQITRDELSATLSGRDVGAMSGMAEFFLIGDRDLDNVLTFDEIKAVAVAETERRSSSQRVIDQLAEVMDFDQNGFLTAEEIDRAAVALELP
ncbi:hypothetical protein [Gemmobacter sp.]|uniref:hypothetical protein n=1 Tax=Gemmobacter sp. TaxID=1898957 RepID=UPI002AFE45E1|nr:hypothetical protein [Gemmobacter sp.]